MSEIDDGPVPAGGTSMISGFLTYSGKGFASVRTEASTGEQSTPASASSRRMLRAGLPALYQENGFGMRFVEALETVLDPVVAVLDGLPAHFDPGLAPVDVLDLVTAWLGVEYDESQPTEQLRELVRHAAELGRRRGTRAGLEMALALNFPGVPLRVEDKGGVSWSTDLDAAPEFEQGRFVVYCDTPLEEDRLAAIARLIEAVKPVNVQYRLRVKAAKKPPGEPA
jgi:phage tail-like protein